MKKHTIFITTYKKYAEGNADGVYITLENFTSVDELMREILDFHSDEHTPELMCTDPAGLPGLPEPVNRDILGFFWSICRDEERETLLTFLGRTSPALESFDFDGFRDDALNALAGSLSEVEWTRYPDFADWAFMRFLAAHPELSEYEHYLDGDTIAREYSFNYTEKNGLVFNRHAY